MPTPTIPPMPTVPVPNSPTFYADCYTFTVAMSALVGHLNTMITWMNANVGAQPIVSVAGTTHDLDAANTGAYHVFSSDSAKTLNVRSDTTHALPAGYTVTGENEGDNDLTIAPAGGVTIRVPLGGSLVVPSGGAFTLIRTAVNSFKLIGDTVAD